MPPGAQIGNTNALKHGFYSKRFRTGELKKLSELAASGDKALSSEIALLRVAIYRVLEQAHAAEESSQPVDWIPYLSVIGVASIRLATMLKTQHYLVGDESDEISAQIRQAISEVSKELNLYV